MVHIVPSAATWEFLVNVLFVRGLLHLVFLLSVLQKTERSIQPITCLKFLSGVLNRRFNARPSPSGSISFFQKSLEDTNQTDLPRYGRCESFNFWKASMMLAVQLGHIWESTKTGWCTKVHFPSVVIVDASVSDSDEFHTSKARALGVKFWELCVYDDTFEARLNSLRDGGTQTDFAPLGICVYFSIPLCLACFWHWFFTLHRYSYPDYACGYRWF